MSDWTLWWIAAGVIVGLEMLTGTFYLLMLAFGAIAAGGVAKLGGAIDAQMVTAAVVGLLAVGGWHYWRTQHAKAGDAAGTTNPDLHLDVGQTLTVEGWSPEGHARVQYRGTQWDARLHPDHRHHQPSAGEHRIRAVQGNVLILEKT